jgi:repressor LexA
MDLSKRQQQVLSFIRSFMTEQGYPPTLREIGAALGIRSTNAVNDHLKALERKEAIVRDRSRSRGINVVSVEPEMEDQGNGIPLIGQIAAGVPLLAQQNIERMLQVDEMFSRQAKPDFALRVVGESMIESGIYDGDIILVRKQETAVQGATVVARVDGEATVKRFFREADGRVRLQPANRDMEPLYLAEDEGRDTAIQGLVIGVMRSLE